MPYSDSRFDKKVKLIFKQIKPSTILDIGPGHGKYARVLKSVIKDDILIDAVEVDKSYIKQFKLKELYDVVHLSSIQNFVDKHPKVKYDLVIFGDVIEHLKKSEGVDVLNFFIYRSKYIMVQWPHGYIQDAWEGHDQEAHVSVWGKSDFANFDFEWYENDYMRLVLVKGFISE